MKFTYPFFTLLILSLVLSCNSDDDITDITDMPFVNRCEGIVVSFNTTELTIEGAMTGGVAPYSFIWSTGETTELITPVVSGRHSCTISDADGCQANFTVLFELPPDDGCVLEMSIQEDAPGQLSIVPSNAIGTISYEWSTGEDSPMIEVLHNGVFRATISDESGCIVKEEILVDLEGPCQGFTANFNGCTDPSIIVLEPTVEGGTPPYMLEQAMSGDNFSDRYTEFTIMDDNGCIFTIGKIQPSGNVFLDCPRNPATVSNTIGTNTYTITSETQNGPFKYLWSTGATTPEVELTGVGSFSVIIEDELGCTGYASFEL